MYNTLYELLQLQSKQRSNRPAIVSEQRPSLTFAQLFIQISTTHDILRSVGICRNDRVALVLADGPEMLSAFLAVGSGATAAPLNPAYQAQEFEAALVDLNIKAVMVAARVDSPARAVARARRLPILELSYAEKEPAGVFRLECDQAGLSDCCDPAFAHRDDVALVLRTSGTTGRPKIVPLRHSTTLAGAQLTAAALELTDNDRYLCVMPLFHVHGLIHSLATLLTGGCVIATPPFAPEHFFRALESFRPTLYSAAPTLHQAILQDAPRYRSIVADNPIRLIRSSAAPLPPGVLTELEEVFAAPVIEGYGMTETALILTSNPLSRERRKTGSVGLPIGTRLSIVDAAGGALSAGEIGEVVVQGPNVIQAYENDEDSNRSAFSNGWFHTGDLGYRDEDGFLYLTGRLREIINRGGEKISPLEVERVIRQHPEVAEAAVFALPHPTLGEDVAAAVVLRPESQSRATDLRRFLSYRLVSSKIPAQMVIIDAIPKGPTGKLQRARLGQLLKERFAVEFVAPRNLDELQLAEIWQEVLGVEQVSINDNFFALGGNSLTATRALNRVRQIFATDISLTSFFQAPTILSFALALRDETFDRSQSRIKPLTRSASADLAQQSHNPSNPVDVKSACPPQGHKITSSMDISLFFFSADGSGVGKNKYKLFLDAVQFADRNGFTAVWIPERHFHPFGGLYPNPSVLGAAAATLTERLQIRAGSVVLPFQDPLRVAEEWSVVDNLSGGRVGLACASGWHVNDFVLAPGNYQERKEIMVERIEVLRRLWRGESITLTNGSGRRTEVRIYPEPIQHRLPLWLAGHSDATFVKAAEIGAHVLTVLWDSTPEDLARRISLYRKALEQQGQDPALGKVTLMLHTFVGESMASVKAIVTPAYRQYLSINLGLQNDMIRGLGKAAIENKADIEVIIAQATEQLFRRRGLVGTAEVCAEKIATFKAMGVDEIACLIDFGIDHRGTLESLERLGRLIALK